MNCKHCNKNVEEEWNKLRLIGFKSVEVVDHYLGEKCFFCTKICRKDYEMDLIKQGKLDARINDNVQIYLEQFPVKDAHGEKIWFPRDGKPYFDKALRRTFNTIEEKKAYMDKNRIVMRGDAPITQWPKEAGEMRNKSYRRSMRWDD